MGKGLSDLNEALEVPTVVTKKLESKEDKFKALKAVEKSINKRFDTTNSLVRLGDKVGQPVPSVSTGIITLDNIIGAGMPNGKVIEMFSPESAGKTTISLTIIGAYQKQGHLCAFIDAEHSLDPSWAALLGVNVDDLFVNQPNSGEEALTVVQELVESGAVGLIVVDSVSALVPQAELDGEMGSSFMGLQARLMSQAMRKLIGIAKVNQTSIIFLNQLRDKIGVIYGSPEVTTGGRALKFYSSVRLDVRRKELIKDGDTIIGHVIQIKCVKNKVGVPFRATLVNLLYDAGIDVVADFIQHALNLGVIERSGAWYSFGSEKLGQGMEKVVEALKSSQETMEKIKKEVAKLQIVENKG